MGGVEGREGCGGGRDMRGTLDKNDKTNGTERGSELEVRFRDVKSVAQKKYSSSLQDTEWIVFMQGVRFKGFVHLCLWMSVWEGGEVVLKMGCLWGVYNMILIMTSR